MKKEVEVKNVGSGVKIMFHGCEHDYQDKKYGRNQRVFNRTKSGWRCTVCGTVLSS